MKTKLCGLCKQDLPREAFYKAKAQSDGLQHRCKQCANSYGKKWRSSNQEKYKNLLNAWRSRNPDYHEKWYKINSEKVRDWGRGYYEKNKDKIFAHSYARRSRVKRQMINLTQKQFEQIKQIYKEARRLSRETGTQYHVDHIFPLNGGNCSGLHVPWNLQIITAEENLKKHKKVSQSDALAFA